MRFLLMLFGIFAMLLKFYILILIDSLVTFLKLRNDVKNKNNNPNSIKTSGRDKNSNELNEEEWRGMRGREKVKWIGRKYLREIGIGAIWLSLLVIQTMTWVVLKGSWSFWECFYYATITLLTIGNGDLVVDSALGGVVVVIFAFLGIGMFGLTIVVLQERVEKNLKERFKKKKGELMLLRSGEASSSSRSGTNYGSSNDNETIDL